MEPILRLIDLYKIYDNFGIETAVIKGISYNIFQSDKVILIGPSGSGKTTLVNIIAGFQQPSAGQVFWGTTSREISKINRNRLTTIRRDFMGFVDNNNDLLPQLNVKENIMLSAYITNRSNQSTKDHFERLTSILNIKHLLKRKPVALSQGEKKRVNIASSLINQPKILLADEPIEGIDPVVGEEILDLFEEVNEQLGTAFLMTTHDQSVADRGDRIIELRNGVLYGSHEKGLALNALEKNKRSSCGTPMVEFNFHQKY